jgi:hypothetical protein
MTFSQLAVAVARPLGMGPLALDILRLLAVAGLVLAALTAATPIRAQEQEPDVEMEILTGELAAPTETLPEPSEPSVEQPAASPAAEGDLWAQIKDRQQEMESARMDGKLTMTMHTALDSELVPVTATMTVQGDLSGEDFDLQMHMEADSLAADMRMVLVGDAAYVNIQDNWVSMPRLQAIGHAPPRVELPNVSGDHVTLTLLGQDEVNGVPCDVYTFVVDPAAATELAQAALISTESIQSHFDEMSGEVCVGTVDGLWRRLSMNTRMAGNPSDGVQGETMTEMVVAYERFDVNSLDIVIRPPEDAIAG